jgi:hypothetical protein
MDNKIAEVFIPGAGKKGMKNIRPASTHSTKLHAHKSQKHNTQP